MTNYREILRLKSLGINNSQITESLGIPPCLQLVLSFRLFTYNSFSMFPLYHVWENYAGVFARVNTDREKTATRIY
jgi:hypothetical protein